MTYYLPQINLFRSQTPFEQSELVLHTGPVEIVP
jgi:hypothetical protein